MSTAPGRPLFGGRKPITRVYSWPFKLIGWAALWYFYGPWAWALGVFGSLVLTIEENKGV